MKTAAPIATAPAMFRAQMPRLYELSDLIGDLRSPNAYFQEFENNLQRSPRAREVYLRWEHDLRLDDTGWEFLKSEASPYLTRRDPLRGWEQLFNILNQARAYNYLRKVGCSDVRFIPRSRQPSPDLEAALNSTRVLCEVKTINPSKKELSARQRDRRKPPVARSCQIQLDAEFFQKLHCVVTQARSQLDAYGSASEVRSINYVYINICFDELADDCKERYYRQIDQYFSTNPISGINLVFHNDRTFISRPLSMTNATVVNEDE